MTREFDRREVLRLGGVAALAAVTPSLPRFALADAVRPTFVLTDGRYDASRAFTRGALQAGAHPILLSKNLAEIWFGQLAPVLDTGPRVAGLTLDSDLFVLRRLAEGSGFRLRYRGTHDTRGAVVAHELAGAMRLGQLGTALAESDWAPPLGAALMDETVRESFEAQERLKITAEKRASDLGGPGYFVSWLLDWSGRLTV